MIPQKSTATTPGEQSITLDSWSGKGSQAAPQACRELNAVTPAPRIIKLLQAEGEPRLQSILREAKLHGPIIPAGLHPRGRAVLELTCKATRFSQQERAPGHQEEQASLQQRELPEFGELGDVADG